jgi:tape measure domain-containing protein
MHKIIAVLPFIALLSACGKADGELTQGNWKNTMTMSKFDIPGAPPAVAERAKAMLGQAQTTETCMSAAQAKAGVRDFSSALQQGECKMEDFTQGSGKMSGKLVCTNSAMGMTAMTMNGSYTPEKVAMTLAGELNDSKLPGGKANIEMSITSERAGDCKS